ASASATPVAPIPPSQASQKLDEHAQGPAAHVPTASAPVPAASAPAAHVQPPAAQ
ncbi:hypothetical protein U1Q18_036330, partial [Sarracenia purpurea var. burkii]